MVENVQFRQAKSTFQSKLKADLKEITSTNKVLIFADKTRNIYATDADNYQKLLRDNITKKYKIADTSVVDSINNELVDIAAKLDIEDRISPMNKQPAFISIKDHKDNFPQNTPCRLINPCKSEMGKVSKVVLDRINQDIRTATSAKQWMNTSTVIDWFRSIEDKNQHTFMVFDIVDFYPSISANLLNTALDWAKDFTTITEQEVGIIMHSRKSLLFNGGDAWQKSNTSGTFDVTMGSFDGAEICELIGLYALHSIENEFPGMNVGLYRDDGLAALKSTPGPSADRIRKRLTEVFNGMGLKIEVNTCLKSVNYLDITLDLETGSFQPYRKPNDNPIFINSKSDHPPAIIRNIPTAVNKRLSELSHNEDSFKHSSMVYREALTNSGHKPAFSYTTYPPKEPQDRNKRNRGRNIIWFNPPYSRTVKTNIGKIFLGLVANHFPTNHKLHKIFNKNNIKVSYSCMRNVKSVIQRHNSRALQQSQQNTDTPQRQCNCRVKANCPLNGECLAASIVYQAEVTTQNQTHTYIGMTGGPFKQRFYNHTKSFKHKTHENETELAKHIWELKEKKQNFSITWSILRRSNTMQTASGQCNLCIAEKLAIINNKHKNLLNKRSEIVSTCRHRLKAPIRRKRKP